MRVVCRFCSQQITLNDDTPETRKAGMDPSQQMRRHLLEHHLLEHLEKDPNSLDRHAYRCGWMIDRLAFACPGDHERFRKNAIALLDAYLEGVL